MRGSARMDVGTCGTLAQCFARELPVQDPFATMPVAQARAGQWPHGPQPLPIPYAGALRAAAASATRKGVQTDAAAALRGGSRPGLPQAAPALARPASWRLGRAMLTSAIEV